MATNKSGASRKHGRNKVKCERYKKEGRRQDKVFKRRIKWLKNRERWAKDSVYQAHQAERKARLAPKPVIPPVAAA